MSNFGRFAPTPSNQLHIGNLRTALFAWIIARASGRNFLIRIEDTETRDSNYTDEIVDELISFGLHSQTRIIKQSQRKSIYRNYLSKLVEAGHTFECFCSRKQIKQASLLTNLPTGFYPQTCANLYPNQVAQLKKQGKIPAIRLKSPGNHLEVVDKIFGSIKMPIDSIVLQKADGTISYNLAMMVDDYLQNVDQVCRGMDLLNLTPTQEYLGTVMKLKPKKYYHVPLIINPKGEKLAKRKGDTTVAELLKHNLSHQQIIEKMLSTMFKPTYKTLTEAVTEFSLEQINTQAWVLDKEFLFS